MRMAGAIEVEQSERTLLIGTDCPTVTPSYLAHAANSLETHDAVLGAVADGGYVLIGMRGFSEHVFHDIVWSTDSVAAITRRRIAELGWSLHELDALWDVDDAADYARWLALEMD